MDKNKIKRPLVQLIASIASNSNLNAKKVCLPGLNCYSCPLASASCPIGAFQAAANSRKFSISFYVTGFLSFIGIIAGRFVCGWLCPFGFIQELLAKIPGPKIKIKKTADRVLRFMKYLILCIFVILIPIFVFDKFGIGYPAFCKYICPAGTLEGGIPLVLLNKGLRASIGFLFKWKISILAITLILSVFIYRPFCKYICPLGAFYSFFNKISFFKIKAEADKCSKCGLCKKVCPMQINMPKELNSLECIRCGKCTDICKSKAIKIKI